MAKKKPQTNQPAKRRSGLQANGLRKAQPRSPTDL
jgi:hypothetical protein